ncbi:MAG TPA: cyclophilin-like fold protein [Burkholderiales bacterium]|nr:cyclophilin-like fold protein [Burkholderiales bacterium]
MNTRIRISWSQDELSATLRSTPTVKKLLAALPCEARAQTWGDEVYFSIPVESVLEKDATQVVEPGTVCFWVEGRSLALPFGPTPVSESNECRLVTRVNVLGKIDCNANKLRTVKDGDRVRLEPL